VPADVSGTASLAEAIVLNWIAEDLVAVIAMTQARAVLQKTNGMVAAPVGMV